MLLIGNFGSLFLFMIMLKIIRSILQKFIDDIDADNSNLSYEEQCNIIRVLSNVGNPYEMSKTQAADYIGVCRATFDNYIRDGLLPRGKKIEGFKELRWYKCDLDLFLANQ